eukprot:828659-Pyramimonas_sp.AAC.1
METRSTGVPKPELAPSARSDRLTSPPLAWTTPWASTTRSSGMSASSTIRSSTRTAPHCSAFGR